MPRGGYRPGAGRPPGAKQEDEAVSGSIHDEGAGEPCAADLDAKERSPLEYMLAVMNDLTADANRRDRMAIAAAPFVHGKIAEGGKKDAKQDAAREAAGGKFKATAPPSLKVVR